MGSALLSVQLRCMRLQRVHLMPGGVVLSAVLSLPQNTCKCPNCSPRLILGHVSVLWCTVRGSHGPEPGAERPALVAVLGVRPGCTLARDAAVAGKAAARAALEQCIASEAVVATRARLCGA